MRMSVVWVICLVLAMSCVQVWAEPVLTDTGATSAIRGFFSTIADNVEPIVAFDFIGKEGLGGVRCQVASKPGICSVDVGLLGDKAGDLALIGGLSADIEGLVERIGWDFDLPDRAIVAAFAGIRLADEENREGRDRFLAGLYAGWEL